MRVPKGMMSMDRILRNNGYECVRVKGSHHIYKNKETNESVTVNINLNVMVQKRLMKEHGLIGIKI